MDGYRARGRPHPRSGPIWYFAALGLAAAVAVLLVAMPRSAEAMTGTLVAGPIVENDNDSADSINLGSVTAQQVAVVHVAGGETGNEEINCIAHNGDWDRIALERNPGGGNDHTAAVFVRSGPFSGNQSFELRNSGPDGSGDGCGNDTTNGPSGITIVGMVFEGVDVNDPVHGSSDTSNDGTSTAPSVSNAPANSLVLRLFSYKQRDTGGGDSPRVVAGNSNSDCSQSQNPNAGRIYGAPTAPGGSAGGGRTVGGFLFTQESQGNTGSFTASYCQHGSDRDEPDSTSVTVVLNVPWTPEVTKRGIDERDHSNKDWAWATWEIEIDNDPPGNQHYKRVQVRFTEDDDLVSGPCTQSGSTITCTVDGNDEVDVRVEREVRRTCETQVLTNAISNVEVRYQYHNSQSNNWTEWQSLPAPGPADATVNRGEGSCIDNPEDFFPPHDPTPTPTATPVATPPAGACAVPHATWNPTPVVPGKTIAIWGGGNVSEFPLPIATSYWTTVVGKWVGYIPGAPTWVNQQLGLFQAYPNGELPACIGFVVFHRP